jgi:hypothetical protein
MKFCIRVDDFGFLPDKSNDSGLRCACRFHEAMAGLPYLAAVIPACLDGDGLDWLNEKPDGMTLAMHGFAHQPAAQGVYSEFHGRTFSECLRMLQEARWMMPIETRHFVAPWDQYTQPLLDALSVAGFDRLWMASQNGMNPPEARGLSRILVLGWRPLCAALTRRMQASDEILLDYLPKIMDGPGRAVICLHVTWETA